MRDLPTAGRAARARHARRRARQRHRRSPGNRPSAIRGTPRPTHGWRCSPAAASAPTASAAHRRDRRCGRGAAAAQRDSRRRSRSRRRLDPAGFARLLARYAAYRCLARSVRRILPTRRWQSAKRGRLTRRRRRAASRSSRSSSSADRRRGWYRMRQERLFGDALAVVPGEARRGGGGDRRAAARSAIGARGWPGRSAPDGTAGRCAHDRAGHRRARRMTSADRIVVARDGVHVRGDPALRHLRLARSASPADPAVRSASRSRRDRARDGRRRRGVRLGRGAPPAAASCSRWRCSRRGAAIVPGASWGSIRRPGMFGLIVFALGCAGTASTATPLAGGARGGRRRSSPQPPRRRCWRSDGRAARPGGLYAYNNGRAVGTVPERERELAAYLLSCWARGRDAVRGARRPAARPRGAMAAGVEHGARPRPSRVGACSPPSCADSASYALVQRRPPRALARAGVSPLVAAAVVGSRRRHHSPRDDARAASPGRPACGRSCTSRSAGSDRSRSTVRTRCSVRPTGPARARRSRTTRTACRWPSSTARGSSGWPRCSSAIRSTCARSRVTLRACRRGGGRRRWPPAPVSSHSTSTC